MRPISIALGIVLAGCASDPPPPPSEPGFTPNAVYAPPQVYAAPPEAAPTAGAFPPSGIYAVVEHVTSDGCHALHVLPPRVTVLSRTKDGRAEGSVPVPTFLADGPATRRLAVGWQGHSGSGVVAPKACPGLQNRFSAVLRDVTNTGFTIAMTSTLSDGEACPNRRPLPACRVEVAYEYRLETLVCDSRCSGSVAGLRTEDVPPDPTTIQCACP